ncbi:bromodomain adjacent to zinc finger domain protein 2A isoform X3 [Syngnathus scovelli]|nr:bromodomain adjacent to zinc finger domain protein 2A isoform X3 [Syngnathus scovelli]XP_049611849.1 bromodomain adjacent to zinc finger domain protein 2A isoform X3 [Syngnathus scovelli]
MEANNHFNYGTHSSANSGLKRSSGDSLYTNGSSMSFPQQGKNMNGEMNVNGITTVLGSSAPASQPPSSPYPHISNHHQSSMDYLWGGHPQYSPTMATSPGHSLHQKQPAPGMVAPQSQHHFQAEGPYQANGDMETPQQSPMAGPSNMPPTSSQFWTRSNPSTQAAAYNSRSAYGTYESQSPPSQHHLHSHLRPPLHLPQQYGVMSNGMPYYQQHHTALPTPQHTKQSVGPRLQNFALSHDTERGPSRAVSSSATVEDGGSLMSREKPPHGSNTSPSIQVHTREEGKEANADGNRSEEAAVRHTVDHHEKSEKPTAPLPEGIREAGASTPPRTTFTGNVSAATTSLNKVSAASTVESPMASSLSTIGSYPDVKSTPPNASSVPPPRHSSPPFPPATEIALPGSKQLLAGSPPSSSPATHPKFCPPPGLTDSVSGHPWVSSSESQLRHSVSGPKTTVLAPAIVSTSSYAGSTPISSLQQMVQGSKIPLLSAGNSNLSVRDASGSVCSSITSPSGGSSAGMLLPSHGMSSAGSKHAAMPQHDSLYAAPTVGSGQAIASVSPPPEGLNLPSQPAQDGPSFTALPPQPTQGSRVAPVSFPFTLASVPPATSTEMIPSSDSAHHLSTPSPVSVLNQLPLLSEHQGLSTKEKDVVLRLGGMVVDSLYAAPAAGSGQAIASVSPPPEGLNLPSQSAQEGPSFTALPPQPTQGSRVAPVSFPFALPSVLPATSTEMIPSSDSARHLSTPSPVSVLNQLPLWSEHQGLSTKEKGLVLRMGTMVVDCLPHLESGKVKMHKASDPQKSIDLPEQPLLTERQPSNTQKGPMARGNVGDVPNAEQTPSRISTLLHRPSARRSSLTSETSFDHSFLTTSRYGDSSACSTPSRLYSSSLFDKSSANSTSRLHDSSSFGNSFHLGNDTSHTEEQPSSIYETTRDGRLSVDYSSLNSTHEVAESMLESSMNNTSFGASHPRHQAGWPFVGLHAADTDAVTKRPTAVEIVTPPSFKMRDENFIAFSTPAQRLAVHPLQPVTDQVLSATGGRLKNTGKSCKPQSPKALWISKSAPEEVKRKPRGRTPKVEKINAEEGDIKEGGPKKRQRKASLRPEQVQGKCGQTPPEEIDSITAAIDAVLANTSAISSPFDKPKTFKRTKKQEQDGMDTTTSKDDAGAAASDAEDNEEEGATAGKGEPIRRRVATEQQVQFALLHGWKREIRVRKLNDRMKGETWYYTPCGRRMKQFPEVIKYLKKHQGGVVTREHFSFSPRMPVGDFYEERESPEGAKWFLLANEEVPSMIMAITGRRGRPPNPDKEKPSRARGVKAGQARRPGRPPKPKMIDFLSKVDAKMLKRLEDKESLTEEEKGRITKIKKKMKRKARIRRREDAQIKKTREDKKRAKQETKSLEVKAEPQDLAAPQSTELTPQPQSVSEPKKPGRRRSVKVEVPPPVQQTDEERIAQGKRVLSARGKAKALAKAQAEAEAAARAALAAKKTAERRVQTQRRLEERKRQQLILEELRKPTEDMCLTDHKPLPELSRVPGVVLSGTAFAHLLAVVEFLHGYGKLIGLDVPKDIPSLATLQEGLLDMGESQGEVQDLLIKLMEAALRDPGLPSYYQSVKILGDKLVELQLTRSTVSEVLRIFLESHGYETEVCNMLRTKSFHALPPETKAAVLGFVAEELNGSNVVTSDIDNTLENMTTYRKNKWIIEGKLRKLKAALARRTGRSEEQLCLEERRRSARVAEEENLSLEESVERSNRRIRKEEPKLSDSESPANASVHDLERQIDKLTKRQVFFRKKLLQSSHSMRVIMLGQDRYRRRYLALPHLGGVLVEGPEELLTSGDVVIAEVPVTFLKKEPKTEEVPLATTPPHAIHSSPASETPQAQTLSPEEDSLPGTASLMSTQKGRGRPRKIKPEVELHLRTAKIRRQRRSSVRLAEEDGPASPVTTCTQDLSQSAFLSWLSQSGHALPSDAYTAEPLEGSQPEESVKIEADDQSQSFKQPSDENSQSEPQVPSTPPTLDAPLIQSDAVAASTGEAPTHPDTPAAPEEGPALTQMPSIPDCSPPPPAPLPSAQTPPAPRTPTTRARPGRRRRRGSRGSSPARRGPRGAAAKRRGRPPVSAFQELEQQYFIQLVVKPIPASMVRGWWWIKDQDELFSTLQALHPRGIREKVLHKHLAKHMESLTEMCTRGISDPMFEIKEEKKVLLLEALQQPWQVQDKAIETDNSALRWVEDLEQRVIGADLHLKAPPPQSIVNDAESSTEAPAVEFQPYTIPERDSTRTDLQYYEHDTDPRDDWIVRTKKEWSGLPRIATHPLDLAVLRLANLERNIERRYLKEPLWNPAEVMRLAPLTPTPGEEQPMDVISLESEITSRLRTWRQALDRCRSAPQLCLCLLQLEKAIAWERSVTKVTCQICRKGDNDDCLLLCDGCDRGCHMYCLRPKIAQVPEGDWFCPTCVAKEESASPHSKKRTRMKKKRYEENSSDDDTTTRRTSGMATRHKEASTNALAATSSSSRHSGESGAAKRRRMTTRNQPDLTFCEIILMEMEAHADAWPFLEPVNPRLVPGYRRIVKNPMDFLTMRERLLQGGYCSCEEFATDAQLVFSNCELFNEDTSEVGMAGHSMRRFFESRWAEFYSNKEK